MRDLCRTRYVDITIKRERRLDSRFWREAVVRQRQVIVGYRRHNRPLLGGAPTAEVDPTRALSGPGAIAAFSSKDSVRRVA